MESARGDIGAPARRRDEADNPERTSFNHFPTREHLYEAIASHRIEGFTAMLELATADPRPVEERLTDDAVLGAATVMAADIAANTAPLSVAYSKQLLWESFGLSAEEVERRETADHHKLMGQPDAREGVLAFLERREPVWSGRVTEEFR